MNSSWKRRKSRAFLKSSSKKNLKSRINRPGIFKRRGDSNLEIINEGKNAGFESDRLPHARSTNDLNNPLVSDRIRDQADPNNRNMILGSLNRNYKSSTNLNLLNLQEEGLNFQDASKFTLNIPSNVI